VDAGSNAAIPAGITTDFAGKPRKLDFPGAGPAGSAVVDMGAYELGFDLGALVIPANTTVTLPTGGYSFSASAMTPAPGSKLDLADSTLALPGDFSAATVRQHLSAETIFSSLVPPTSSYRIGYATTNDGASLLVRRTIVGDATLDGRVDADDLILMDRGRAKHLSTWHDGDFNYDGVIDDADAALLHPSYVMGPSAPAGTTSAAPLAIATLSVAPANTKPHGKRVAPQKRPHAAQKKPAPSSHNRLRLMGLLASFRVIPK
jgi:hypothetical protein